MRVSEVPVPACLRRRGTDSRGYPLPAVLPWDNGRPQFSLASPERQILAMAERRCAICALPLSPAQLLWHVLDHDATVAVRQGMHSADRIECETYEAPGHRRCMLYAAIVCPYLATSTARRSSGVTMPDRNIDMPKGTVRGDLSAVAGFRQARLDVRDGVYSITMINPVTIDVYRQGHELLPMLVSALDRDDDPLREHPLPAYFGPDSGAVTKRLHHLRLAVAQSSQAPPALRQAPPSCPAGGSGTSGVDALPRSLMDITTSAWRP